MVDQVPDEAAKPVEAPDHESVPGADLVQELIELEAWLGCAGGGVGEDTIATCCTECIELKLCVLVASGDSGVSEEVSHDSRCINTRGMITVSTHSFWYWVLRLNDLENLLSSQLSRIFSQAVRLVCHKRPFLRDHGIKAYIVSPHP